jgi:hypothetical protein
LGPAFDRTPGAGDTCEIPEILVEERFRGPPNSGNGGYVCGRLASFLDGTVQVTLRVPPPLQRPLQVEARDGGVVLLDGDQLVAEAQSVELATDEVRAADPEQARAGAARYAWADPEVHPYPTCFVCGPARDEGDGMLVFPGPVPDTDDLYAAPWLPDDSLLDPAGCVRPEFIWSALDCPSGLVTNTFAPEGRILLGRLTARLLAPARGGEEYVITAWPVSREGRKMATGSALYSQNGDLLAVARALWIEVAG